VLLKKDNVLHVMPKVNSVLLVKQIINLTKENSVSNHSLVLLIKMDVQNVMGQINKIVKLVPIPMLLTLMELNVFQNVLMDKEDVLLVILVSP